MAFTLNMKIYYSCLIPAYVCLYLKTSFVPGREFYIFLMSDIFKLATEHSQDLVVCAPSHDTFYYSLYTLIVIFFNKYGFFLTNSIKHKLVETKYTKWKTPWFQKNIRLHQCPMIKMIILEDKNPLCIQSMSGRLHP